ncbi:MAG: hypothetical protein COV46_01465 [Deltaproteobacteria bacterium CG11_big_fil_rev_8_21_14_0_20_49_13]|nr:MAG: hypothetical protein COV46_01465 [Deltaproteobacteria bacterium CG11_big_fil_rev_8_21_14_0_20_49_13]
MFRTAGLSKKYDEGGKSVAVLNGLDFLCEAGEFVGVFGASGAGKSTLLHMLGGLDKPTDGKVYFNNENIYSKGNKELAAFRNKKIGFVFQFYHLLPEFTALENVMLPCLIAGISKKKALELASEAIGHVGMEGRVKHRPNQLSGGEQQRVAVARAIVMRPEFILADEPTGNLDEETGIKVFSCLEALNRGMKTGIIMVTHNPDLLKRIPKKFELRNGTLHAA